MRAKVKKKKAQKPAGNRQLGKADWVKSAKLMLIKHGISEVKVEKLAANLKVTIGSFYWHFTGRPQLYEAIIADWLATNTRPLEDAVANSGPDPRHQYLAFFGVWVLERNFDPAYDNAIRVWSQSSSDIEKIVAKVEAERVTILFKIFQKFGYDDDEAKMRARVTYYHQVGYYALHVRESTTARLDLAPLYAKILVGFDWMGELTRAEIDKAMHGEKVVFSKPIPKTEYMVSAFEATN